MKLKKIAHALLFPHIAIMIFLIPVAAVFLVGSMVFIGTESPIAIVSYVIAAYTLTVWCFKIPYLIKFFGTFKKENRYYLLWRSDARLRVNLSLFGSLFWNGAYALFQLWLGFYHHTFWFYSFAAYYALLAIMRFFLVRHTRAHRAGELMQKEYKKYRACGTILLFMNLALSLIVFFMVYWDRTFNHHEITTIAMATYTFTAFTLAVVNIIRYRKYNSPVYSASKAISLAAASVSMLTLTSTMMTTFADGTMGMFERRLFLGLVGGAVCLFVMIMAIFMIAKANRELKKIREKTQKYGK